MSAVPNRYYNSPWIADAGRNLAAALAPPDPEKTMAAKKAQFDYERAMEKANYEDEDRQRILDARAASGRLLLDDYDKPAEAGTGPQDMGFAQWMGAGQPEQKSTRDDFAYNQDIQAATGGMPLGDVMSLLGPENPKIQALMKVNEAKAGSAAALAAEKAVYARELADVRDQNNMLRVERNIGSREKMQGEGFEHDFEKQARGFEHDLVEIDARADAAARAKGKTPVKIYGAILKDIRLEIKRLEKQYGIPLDDNDRREMAARIGEEMQDNPNVPAASAAVFKRTLGGGADQTKPVEVPGKWYGTNTENRLAPDWGASVTPGLAPGEGVFAAPGQLTPPPTNRPPLGGFYKK